MSGEPEIAWLALTPGGLALARRLQQQSGKGRTYGLRGRTAGADVDFEETVAQVAALFRGGHAVAGICAAGILVRAVAPHLGDKHDEPPLIAVAEDGGAVVPLLGGHRGANELARRIAAISGGHAALTTLGEVRYGVALDAPPPGWRLANPEHHKAFVAELAQGRGVTLDDRCGGGGDNDKAAIAWLLKSRLPLREQAPLTITLSENAVQGTAARLVYHPARLALGVGCERDAAPQELITLVRRTLESHGLSPLAVAVVVSISLKIDEPAVHALADALGVAARFYDATTLHAERARLVNPSEAVFAETGCYGVAEGAALAAAGDDGVLLAPKHKSERATCAIARAPAIIAGSGIGIGRGQLSVVGLGPGDTAWRTPEAEAALRNATDLVGYSLYLELAGTPRPGQRLHPYAIGEERERVAAAIALAEQGREVALVCSGDPGIYAMASLVYEQLDERGRAASAPARQRPAAIAVRVVPGISALQAAAARGGAPLGHDFCAISLSDLMTPWDVIEKRIRAAAAGDFVIGFYNPVSQRRTRQLQQARDILLQHRGPQTPVVIARNLGREGEAVTHGTLAALTSDTVDMRSIVLVGASQTRALATADGRRIYTPRGYSVPATGAAATAATGAPDPAPAAMVHFIGAGPGAPDLITVRGRELVRNCPVVLYAGSLVPQAVVAEAAPGARVLDSAPLTLDHIIKEIADAHRRGLAVARVHSGDPALYGAIAEQIRRLDALHIPWDITPGVPAYAAAAAVLGRELTLPEISQTVVLTRTTMKASPMPDGETLAVLGASGATLAIHLSVRNLRRVREELLPHYGKDCPVAVVYRATWPEQLIIRGTLANIHARVRAAKITRTALILVGRVLADTAFPDSCLYDPEHVHVLRPRRRPAEG